MGKQFTAEQERLNKLEAFSKKDTADLQEGTSSYYKWTEVGQQADFTFEGTEVRNLDSNDPTKMSECAILKNFLGEKFIMAQTVVVKELKKKWDTVGEIGFPVRIIYKGEVGAGSDKYQSFRLLFE